MKKGIIWGGSLTVLLIVALLVAPSFIDWNSYKPEITAQARQATGRDVLIDGDIEVALLPAPTLIVGGVRLANLAGASSADMATLDKVRVRIAIWPLFSGRIEVASLSLVRPVVSLEALADGRRNWDFLPAGSSVQGTPVPAPASGPTQERSAPEPATAQASAAPAIRFNDIQITDGVLVYRDQSAGTEQRIDGLNADLELDSLSGPFRAEGKMRARGIDVTFAADVGGLGEAPTGVQLRLNLPGAEMRLDGQLWSAQLSSNAQAFSGKLSVKGENLHALVAGLSPGGAANFPAQPFAFDGLVDAGASAAALNDLSLTVGDTVINGAANATFKPSLKADLVLAAGRVDLDGWLANTAPNAAPNTAGSGPVGAPAGSSVENKAAGGFSLPADVEATIGITAEALIYRGAAIREARLNARLAGGRLRVDTLAARLPGDAEVNLAGVVMAVQGAPRLDGTLSIAADNLRGVLKAFGAEPTSVPAERLRNFRLTSRLRASPAEVRIEDLDARLDVSRLRGSLVFAPSPRPALGVSLGLDRLDLDAYLPAPKQAGKAVAKPAAADKSGASGPAAAGVLGLAAAVLIDGNIDLTIGEMVYGGHRARGLRLDAALQGGDLVVRSVAVADVAGASARISGKVTGLARSPAIDLALSARTDDGAALFRLGGSEPPMAVRKLGSVTFDATAKGSFDEIALNAIAKLTGGAVTVAGQVRPTAGLTGSRLTLRADHPEVSQILAILRPDAKPSSARLGPLEFEAVAVAEPSGYALSGVRASVGKMAVTGAAALRLDGPKPRLEAQFSGNELVLDPFLVAFAPPPSAGGGSKGAPPPRSTSGGTSSQPPWSSEPIDFSPLQSFDATLDMKAAAIVYGGLRLDQAEAKVTLANGVLDAQRVAGKLVGGSFNFGGQLDSNGTPQARARLTVDGADIRQVLKLAGQISIADGMAALNADLAASGASQMALVSSLAGTAQISVRDGVIKGFDLSAVSDRLKRLDQPADFLRLLQAGLSGGQTAFSTLGGTISVDKGIARSDDLRLVAKSGVGTATGMVDLPRWLLDITALFRLTEHGDAPPFGVSLSGPLDQPRQVFELNALQNWLVQRGLGKVLRDLLPDAAPAPDTPAGQSEPAPQKMKPEDALRNILRGLGR